MITAGPCSEHSPCAVHSAKMLWRLPQSSQRHSIGVSVNFPILQVRTLKFSV